MLVSLNRFHYLLLISLFSIQSIAQELQPVTLKMDLNQAIELAQKQSIQSFKNKNMYLSKYWQFRSYKASRLPSLDLNTTPLNYNGDYVYKDHKEGYVYEQKLTSEGGLSVNQNLVLTGGVISVGSQLRRDEYFNLDSASNQAPIEFHSWPVSVNLDQPLNGFNDFRWQSRLEPLKFEIAKREFLFESEDIAIRTVQRFFNVVANEINLKISTTNYHNADTLYRIAKGRFEIGTVTQDELLDLELGLLNSKINLTKAELSLKQSKILLNSYLGLDESVTVNCEIPSRIPKSELNVDRVLAVALENNPEVWGYQQRRIEADYHIASERSKYGISMGLRGSVGLSNQANNINEVYQPEFQRGDKLRLALNIPIIDWGERKGKIQIARAEKEVIEAQVRQARIDFNQNVFQQVMEYNVQDDQVEVAAKADTVATLGYDVTKQRFLIGKIDVLKLNAARNSVDAAKRNYVDALHRFWNYYYSIRQLTLYDFESNQSLMKELDYLLEK